jgi:transposase
MPGNRNDTVGVAPLIKGLKFDALLADKAFDSNWIIDEMNARGALICISQRPQRLAPLKIDMELYKSRHLIENFFCKLKDFKRIALRAEKTDTSFAAIIYAVAALINSQ